MPTRLNHSQRTRGNDRVVILLVCGTVFGTKSLPTRTKGGDSEW